jgi:hypothetical protein
MNYLIGAFKNKSNHETTKNKQMAFRGRLYCRIIPLVREGSTLDIRLIYRDRFAYLSINIDLPLARQMLNLHTNMTFDQCFDSRGFETALCSHSYLLLLAAGIIAFGFIFSWLPKQRTNVRK